MLRRIVAPQTLRYAIPGLGNVWQLVLKDSALVSVIGLVELMRQAQIGADQPASLSSSFAPPPRSISSSRRPPARCFAASSA